MRLNTIKPSDGSKKKSGELVEELDQALEKLRDVATKAKNLEQAVFIKSALKAGKCLFKEDFQKEVLDPCLSLTMQK